jgi:ubiquitin fusion degradation protein 1
MMENLLMEENEFLRIERTSLPVATYCQFQPLSADFLDITNPKVVLEHALRNFSCLTAGDLIAIRYNDRRYELNVLETKPADAVAIVECDMRVEFATPVGFKEQQPQPLPHAQDEEEPMDTSEPEESKVLSCRFPGGGVRMDGKPVESCSGSSQFQGKRGRDEPDFSYQICTLRFIRTCPPGSSRRRDQMSSH